MREIQDLRNNLKGQIKTQARLAIIGQLEPMKTWYTASEWSDHLITLTNLKRKVVKSTNIRTKSRTVSMLVGWVMNLTVALLSLASRWAMHSARCYKYQRGVVMRQFYR